MLNLFDQNKVYYDNFSYYFDRGQNLNVIFSFNFYKFILDNVPNSTIDFALLNKDRYSIKVFLTKENQFKNYIELFDSYTKVNLTTTPFFVDTYFCSKRVSNLSGNYRVMVKISYGSIESDYLNYEIPLSIQNSSKLNNLKYEKIINEPKYAFFEQKSNNVENQYMFMSEDININLKDKYIYNLYDIYSNNITYNNLSSYLSSLEVNRGIKYDGSLTTNNYYDQEQKPLDFNFINNSGDKTNYTNLVTKIFQNSLQEKQYKEICYSNNLFIQTSKNDRNRKESIKSYEVLAGSLTSTACENDLFNEYSKKSEILSSDILMLSFYYDNIYNLSINDFWKDDITLLPVYVLDVKTKYKMYYMSSLLPDSMTQNWNLLDRTTLENLTSGNYLCKIVNDEIYLTNLLMENYFILNK
jgi:hypothetical protein